MLILYFMSHDVLPSPLYLMPCLGSYLLSCHWHDAGSRNNYKKIPFLELSIRSNGFDLNLYSSTSIGQFGHSSRGSGLCMTFCQNNGVLEGASYKVGGQNWTYGLVRTFDHRIPGLIHFHVVFHVDEEDLRLHDIVQIATSSFQNIREDAHLYRGRISAFLPITFSSSPVFQTESGDRLFYEQSREDL